MRLRNRHRLRRKEIEGFAAELVERFGGACFTPDDTIDRAEAPRWDVLIVNGKTLAFLPGGRVCFTVRGLLAYTPTQRHVTVDMGAVPYVAKGADVMVPGIVEADPAVAAGDLVWVRDERNRRPLAVGEALLSGADIRSAGRGKAVKTLHFVGDDLWNLDEPQAQ